MDCTESIHFTSAFSTILSLFSLSVATESPVVWSASCESGRRARSLKRPLGHQPIGSLFERDSTLRLSRPSGQFRVPDESPSGAQDTGYSDLAFSRSDAAWVGL